MPEKKTAEKKPAVKKTAAKTATKKTAEKTEAEKKTAAKKKTAANKTAAKAAAAEKKTAAKATAAEKKAAITEKKAVTTKKAAAVKKETSEKKTAANKTAANKTAAKKTASGKTTEKKTAEKKTAEKKIIEKKTTDTEKKSSAKKTAEKKTDTVKTASEKKSTDKKARTVKADDKKPVAKEKKAAKEESPKEETKKAPSGRGRKKKAEEPARLMGKIRSYRWDKHFGFISTEDADFFFHVNDLQEKKARIKPGMEVSFEFIENEKGRHAVNIAFTGNIIKPEDNKSGVNETDIKEKQSSEKQKSADGNGASKKEADKKTKEAAPSEKPAPSKKPANKKESAENKAEPVEDAPKKETRNTRKKYRQPDKKDEGEYGVDYQLSWLGKEYTIIDKDCVSRYSNGRANSIIIAHEEVREPQEIDEIVVSEGGVFLIETKRYSGETSINSNGNWILTTRGEKQGIMSPVAQTYRHRMIMRTILEGLVDDKYIYDIICIAKDDAIIEGEENCPIPVMKVDMLNHYIDATSRKSGAGLDRAKVAERIEACKISWNEETESYDSMYPELLEKKRTKRSRRGKKKPEE